MKRLVTAREQVEMLSPWREAMPTYYHFTDNSNFRPDPNHTPADLYADEGGQPYGKGLFVSPEHHVDEWAENFPSRDYRVEMHSDEDLNTTDDPDPFEVFVPGNKLHRLRVKNIRPVS